MNASLQIDGSTTDVQADESLFSAAHRIGVRVPSSCQGRGKCRECLVEIQRGAEFLGAPGAEEHHLTGAFRLACCARPVVDCPAGATIEARTLRRASIRVEERALNLPGRAGLSEPALDPAVTRDGIRVLLDGREIARQGGPIHGLAMDLGTTTVALRCVDLETGETIATTAFENPQRFGGTDVMARIQYDTDHPGRLMQRTLIGYLARAIEELPVDSRLIYEMTVAGNPTMRDLFFGCDVRSIGQKPYWSQSEHDYRSGRRASTAIEATAKSLRLPLHPQARVYGLPLVGGHVGADAAACLLALGAYKSDELVAIMDIGTNTELFLGNRHRLLAASCPAGPAFEGRSISCGMPGLDGAIARVALRDDGSVLRTAVLGDGDPTGICGSGLIDLLGELRRTGMMNEYGRFEDGSHAFTVAPDQRIALTEADINELAQAKGANVAGLSVVAKRYGCALGAIDRFYLAGGFGRHLDVSAARRIGLIPNLPDERITVVGNAAIEGAAQALLSTGRRREIEHAVRGIEHVELETDPDFFDHFVAGCQFRPIGAAEEAIA